MSYHIASEVDAAISATEQEDRWGEPHDGWVGLYQANLGTRTEVSIGSELVTVELAGKYEEGENDGYGAGVWVVVRAGDQFFKKTGWTSSSAGDTFDGECTEVRAVQKTITVFE